MTPRYRRTEAEWAEKYERFEQQMALARERGLIPSPEEDAARKKAESQGGES